MNKAVLITLIALTLAGCASDRAYTEGQRLLAEGKTEEGIQSLEQAVRDKPGNAQYRATLAHSREAYLNRLLAEADTEHKGGRLQQAEARYRDVLRLHPQNPRAAAGLAAIEASVRNGVLLAEAEAAMQKGEYATAQTRLRTILAKEPGHARAEKMLKQAEDKAGRVRGIEFPQLAASLRRPATLEFRDAPLKLVLEAVSRQGGFNIVFDKDVRLDQKTTLFARDTALDDALDMLLATSQLARKVLNANTILIYPNQTTKLKDYEDVIVKSFFLSNASAKQVVNMIKSMARTKDIYLDEDLNMVMVRDTPEAVRLIEKLVRVADRALPEVLLEVEIMEVKRSRLMELGTQWPNQFTLLGKETQITPVLDQYGNKVGETKSYIDAPMTLALLEGLADRAEGRIGISPAPGITALKNDSDVNILANPRIRVKNKEKARIHIGDKVPVITSNVTSTGVTSESVSYLDVGLKLDVEPQVHLEGDVAIKIGLEVSNIVREVKSATGTLTYQLGSRNATTVLRLQDGETQMLAGLISDEDRAGATKVPGFGDLPMLGRLFSNHRDESNKTEIVLLITPRIIRNVERPELSDAEFFAGTEGSPSDQPLRLRPATAVAPRPAPPSRQPPEPQPESAPETGAQENAAPAEQPAAPVQD